MDDRSIERAATQQTNPAQGEPIETPVPERDEIEGLLSRSAKPIPQDEPLKDQGDALED
jgi:hypothetical protein